MAMVTCMVVILATALVVVSSFPSSEVSSCMTVNVSAAVFCTHGFWQGSAIIETICFCSHMVSFAKSFEHFEQFSCQV